MNKVLLFLNGEVPTILPDTSNYEMIFCTDGAFRYLKNLNIKPDVISGDFDSIELKDFPTDIEIITTPDQNDTDFVKILTIIQEKGFTNIDVFGASGRQQDHFLGNLNAAFRFKNELNIVFYDNYSSYFFAEKYTELEGYFGRTISLIPFPECKNITTKGLEFPLNKEDLNLLSRIGTRNKSIDDKVTIEFESGDLVIFIIDQEFPVLLA
ncbi:thiamine pyrophosphokinase [Algoriella xinjiangensis]|uniref:Thiamine diphosphokinase n=1 Tax=Algoriella xinjiangensis TaxID=684065 RepID=A0A1I4W6L5_9FLAO|nr:thiamine pyrophosphokinase [Algoriella xinjiangensis]VDH15672.1 Thiamine pyrophosphokinase [Algoriella xinjiangensis]